jgi:hypothetical protein
MLALRGGRRGRSGLCLVAQSVVAFFPAIVSPSNFLTDRYGIVNYPLRSRVEVLRQTLPHVVSWRR